MLVVSTATYCEAAEVNKACPTTTKPKREDADTLEDEWEDTDT